MEIELNEQFNEALKIIESGKNLILTGRAGTGKSTFLKYLCENTKKQYVLLAPTGVSAVNIGGQTIHSFFKFKPNVTIDEAVEIANRNIENEIYRKIDLMIIDEISMVRADLLDCMDIFLKIVRKNKKPFGGVQILFVGDLYQLPPVVDKEEKEIFTKIYETPYFFSSNVMKNFSPEFIEFEKIYRQKEREFIDILNAIRNDKITEEMIKKLNERYVPDFNEEENQDYIYLTSRNEEANEINRKNLEKLEGQAVVYTANVEGTFDPEYFPTDLKLKLKKSARVMLLNNDNFGRWINGSLGWIKNLHSEYIEVILDNGKEITVEPYQWEINELYFDKKEEKIKKRTIGTFSQIPVQLAWAITIHKSQGKTFEKVIIDIGKGIFAPGQLYVALSRCRTIEGIILKKPIEKKHIYIDKRVVKFLTKYQYKKAEEDISLDEKILLIKRAIEEKKKIQITYLKSNDEKTHRVIYPQKIYETELNGIPYIALEGYCYLKNKKRVFNLKKILKAKLIE